jgi:hypothetical protein
VRAADIGTFLPFDAEPPEIAQLGLDELGSDTVAVEVLVAENEDTSRIAGAALGDPEGAGVTEVEQTGR